MRSAAAGVANRAALTSRRARQELPEVTLVAPALEQRHHERSDRAHDLRDLVRLEVGATLSVETLGIRPCLGTLHAPCEGREAAAVALRIGAPLEHRRADRWEIGRAHV